MFSRKRANSEMVLGALALGMVLTVNPGAALAAGEVNVYSYRQNFLVKPLFDAFTEQTGIAVNVVYAKKGLIERLKAEGANSPADLLLTTDIGRLSDAVEAGLTQSSASAVLAKNIPARYRHPEGKWYGMSSRVRILYASRDRVKPGAIQTYEDLAKPEWKGRICTRSGKHVYNIALIASMIAHHGTDKAEAWLKAVKGNLARKPQGNDRAQVKAIWQGECDLALGNHYYYGKMLYNKKQKAWADAVRLVFPNAAGRGTHANVSGVALTKAAPNKANAIKLMEFLSGPGQTLYAEQNYEYPVNASVPWLEEVKSWGTFKADKLGLSKIADLRSDAIKMVDRVGFDN